MVIAIVGAGGKTTLLHELAARYRAGGKRVFVTTTTRMYIEPDTLLTDDPRQIIDRLQTRGYAMAGVPVGEKIAPLSPETYRAVCRQAEVVLVEADGSKHRPLKFPNATEPVIPDNADRIVVVCGLHGLGRPAGQVCHRPELALRCLGIGPDTPITPDHVRTLVTEGYLLPLSGRYPGVEITVYPAHDGSEYQRSVAKSLTDELK